MGKSKISKTAVLVTGGSGLLGGELKKVLPKALFPTSGEFNITNYQQMAAFLKHHPVTTIIHAAAFISAPKIDQDPLRALEVNIGGTVNLVKLCSLNKIKLIYISTDYVFDGKNGRYKEDDPVWPVNKYAWSKLGGECAVRLLDNYLIVRTSFGPNIFPYEKAFTDQWTSRENVKTIAGKIGKLVKSNIQGTIHVGGPRRTVWQYASSLAKLVRPVKKIGRLSLSEVSFIAPRDTSLNTKKFDQFYGKK